MEVPFSNQQSRDARLFPCPNAFWDLLHPASQLCFRHIHGRSLTTHQIRRQSVQSLPHQGKKPMSVKR